jgi:hypothetical protein
LLQGGAAVGGDGDAIAGRGQLVFDDRPQERIIVRHKHLRLRRASHESPLPQAHPARQQFHSTNYAIRTERQRMRRSLRMNI